MLKEVHVNHRRNEKTTTLICPINLHWDIMKGESDICTSYNCKNMMSKPRKYNCYHLAPATQWELVEYWPGAGAAVWSRAQCAGLMASRCHLHIQAWHQFSHLNLGKVSNYSFKKNQAVRELQKLLLYQMWFPFISRTAFIRLLHFRLFHPSLCVWFSLWSAISFTWPGWGSTRTDYDSWQPGFPLKGQAFRETSGRNKRGFIPNTVTNSPCMTRCVGWKGGVSAGLLPSCVLHQSVLHRRTVLSPLPQWVWFNRNSWFIVETVWYSQTKKTHICVCVSKGDEDDWSPWSEWTHCSVTCGLGEQQRGRSCNAVPSCAGPAVQTRSCTVVKCNRKGRMSLRMSDRSHICLSLRKFTKHRSGRRFQTNWFLRLESQSETQNLSTERWCVEIYFSRLPKNFFTHLFLMQELLMGTGAFGPRGPRAQPHVVTGASRGFVSATTRHQRGGAKRVPAAQARHVLATTHSAPVSILEHLWDIRGA